jgi:hypothetical protein
MSQVSGFEGRRKWRAANPDKVKEHLQKQKNTDQFRKRTAARNWQRKKASAAKQVAARIGRDDDLANMARIMFEGVT